MEAYNFFDRHRYGFEIAKVPKTSKQAKCLRNKSKNIKIVPIS